MHKKSILIACGVALALLARQRARKT